MDESRGSRVLVAAVVGLVGLGIGLTGCAPETSPSPSASTASPTPSPTPSPAPPSDPTPTPSATGESEADAEAREACVLIAEKNFISPGVREVLVEASGHSSRAAALDPTWSTLDAAIAAMIQHFEIQAEVDQFSAAIASGDAECLRFGFHIITD